MKNFICHSCGNWNDYNNIGYESRDTIKCKQCVEEQRKQLSGMSLVEIVSASLKKNKANS